MSTYTAGDIAVPMVPSFDGFFEDISARLRRFEPPEVKIRPDVDTEEAENSLSKGGLVAAGAAVGLLIGAAITKSVSDALDFSAANGKLQAQMGLSAQDAGRYGKIAGDLYSQNYGDSIDGVNDALRAVMQSGALAADATDQQIQGVTGSVLNLSTAFGVDATESANALGQMMRTGLAPDAQTALDIIYRGFQLGDDKAGDFLDTLNEYSTQFRKLGLNGADATGLISQGLQAGARDSDLVADAIKEFSIRAVDGSKTTQEGFQAIGKNAGQMAERIGAGGDVAKAALGEVLDGLRNIKDPTQQAQAATELFGTQAEDLGAALFALHPETAAAGLGQIGGAADQAGQALQTPSSRLEAFQRTLQTTIVDLIGGKILPIFSTLIDWGGRIFSWGPVPEILSFLGTTGGVVVGLLLAVVAATKAWTIAQAAFNAVAAMNPITLIIIAIAALVAAVIWAYNNVGWFRDLVQGAFAAIGAVASWVWTNILQPVFSGIATVATWLWTNILQPVFSAIGAAFTAIGTALSWVWTNIISPVFSFIATAAQVLFTIIFTVLVTPLLLAWQAIAAAATWLWQNIFAPVFSAIGAFVTWVWQNVLQPVFAALVWFWQNVIAPAATWLWQNIFVPIFNGIGAIVQWVWNNVIKPALDSMVWLWQNVLAPVLNWLWHNIFEPAFQGMGTIISFVWNNIIKPTFDALVAGVNWVKDGFQTAVDWIGNIWNGLKSLLAKPINFLIGTVFNNGIRKAWNFAADLLPGVDPIDELPLIPEAATGGLLHGPGTGTSDSILGVSRAGVPLVRVSDGEFVVNAKVTKATLPFLTALNAGDGEALQAAGGLARVAKRYRGPKSGIPGRAAGGPIEERMNAAYKWLSGEAQGIPYVWGGGGRSGMDCSGMVAAVTHILSGRSPYSGRLGTTATMPWPGFVGGIEGSWAVGNKPADHMAGTLGGKNVEQHGPNGTPFSFPSRWGADNGYFTQQFHLAELGGKFVSGGSGGGGFFNWILDQVRSFYNDATDPVINAIKALMGDPPPQWRKIPVDTATNLRDKIGDFLFGEAEAAGGGDGVGDVSGITGPVVDQVRQVAARYGWGDGPEWDALSRLVQGESGWDPNAANKSSSARGLFQKLTRLHGPIESTPAGQAAWGLSYIQGAYGDPINAYRQWSARSPHWYDAGGELPPGATTVMNGLGHSETVLPLPPKLVDNLLARGGDGAQITLTAREPMSNAEISRLADEVVRKTQWARRTG